MSTGPDWSVITDDDLELLNLALDFERAGLPTHPDDETHRRAARAALAIIAQHASRTGCTCRGVVA